MQRKSTQGGSVTVEYALSFLLFFSLLLAVMDYARFVASYNLLAGATREGARYAIVHGGSSASPASTTDVETQVKRWCIGLNRSNITVDTTWPDGTNARGQRVRVRTRYAMRPFTGILMNPAALSGGGGIFTGTITVASLSEMLISR